MCLLSCSCGWLFFYPSKQLFHLPSELGVSYREVTFPSLDGTPLVGWWLPAEGVEQGTVVFLHGNAENISTHIGAVYWLPKRGYRVFLFDYQGYGASGGSPSIARALGDSRAAMHYVASETKQKFHLFGQSLGGSLAILAAAGGGTKDLVRSITVEGAFASFRGIMADKAAEIWPLWPIQWLPGLFVGNEPPVKALSRLPDVPFLVIHGEKDAIVPSHHATQIYRRAREPKTSWFVDDGKHGDTFTREEYRDRFVSFLQAAQRTQTDETLPGNRDEKR